MADERLARTYDAYLNGQMSPDDVAIFGRAIESGEVDIGPLVDVPENPDFKISNAFRKFARGEMEAEDEGIFAEAIQSGAVTIPPAVIEEMNAESEEESYQQVRAENPHIDAEPPPGFFETFAGEVGPAFKDQASGAVRGGLKYAAGPFAVASDMAFDPLIRMINENLDMNFTTFDEVISQAADAAGIPEPKSAGGKIMRSMVQMAGGGLQSARLAKSQVGRGGDTAQRVSSVMAKDPASQAAAGLTAGASSEVAAQAGGGPGVQLAAGVLGGLPGAGISRATGRGRAVPKTDVDYADPAAIARREAAAAKQAQTTLDENLGARRAGIADADDQLTKVGQGASLADDASTAALEASEVKIAAAAKKLGKDVNQKTVAGEFELDPETVAAAERRGYRENLQADHLTSNQAAKDLAQVAKAEAGSSLRAKEGEGLIRVAEKTVEDLVDGFGGSQSPSTTTQRVRDALEGRITQLKTGAEKLYTRVREGIPKGQRVPLANTRKYLKARLDSVDGKIELLSPDERRLYRTIIEPTDGKTVYDLKYSALDRMRRGLTQARVKKVAGALYTTMDDNDLIALEKAVMADQKGTLKALSPALEQYFSAAQKTYAVMHGARDDMVYFIGKNMERSVMPMLESRMRDLPKNGAQIFLDYVKRLPRSVRKQTVSSGLMTVLGATQKSGKVSFKNYADWYDKLRRDPQAHAALMANLPAEAGQALRDTAKVFRQVSNSLQKYTPTGRVNKETIQSVEGVVGALARFLGTTTAAKAGTVAGGSTVGGGLSLVVAKLTGAKADAVKALDEFLASSEFAKLMAKANAPSTADRVAQQQVVRSAARAAANKPSFKRFVKQVGSPKELINPITWLINAAEMSRDIEREGEGE